MKRILVTGGAGFLGSHLIDRLLKQGHEIVCVDNLQTGSLRNIDHVMDAITFIQHDITEPLPELGVFDEIYNLACPASPIHYQANPIHTFKTNILGSLQLLEIARKCGAKILQASTSEVYGDPLVHPQPEQYWGHVNPIGIRSCYDEGKRGAETLFFDYARMYDVRIKVVRIFNTYGPRMDAKDGRVVSNFIVQSLHNKPLTVYGDGQQTRSFCYVDDLIEGFLRMMETPEEVTGPINLGNPDEFTMLELAEKVMKWTKNNTELKYELLPEDDPKQRKPVIEEAKRVLNWYPKVTLDEGLQPTILYFDQLINKANS
ncbi:MAG: UDP-glucuronic acid decarboxylase family protein [Paenibacillus macerans]|uniref:UDP-glucuronic acid decarboxylase family protein n=1 Tax=Paenibacillus macerans TaxID=44252 RepID=UPI000EE8297E|nr:UDP-glucuronic acid decarboxylase family protein [Paenibacillus macerans]MBS5911259.1 SDR family oxidoreductase [Paenibacillus macerans]MDU7475134.1 UDP-glucuronic acid decarboxylase family protein [Paenibacillus macerans]MEC0328184.1 SDR family oxidoreductase [Paenibacillus macerans]GBK65086.1 NAD-dependent epimerase/dehydratase family protein [Paenibacillus macerans]GBK71379.1 NAD-dependent epimerase/dehydratase family protein [Paenibacillus macerans]